MIEPVTYTLTCVLIMFVWAFIYFKTYQLCGYNIRLFICKSIEFKLAFGDKSSLKPTKRMIRFIVFYLLICAALFFVIHYLIFNTFLKVFDCVLIYLFTPLLIVFAHYLILPLEIFIKWCYKSRAKKKLGKSNCVKIGITGSYGKTSVKNILAEILGKEYKVCITPKSYNTPMGITKTVLEKLDDEDVFIAEMGAKHIGDIREVASIVQPDYSIINTIGPQHLETFKSIENIEKTKYELVESTSGKGKIIFNGDSTSTIKLYDKCLHEKYITNVENGYAYAKDVKVSKNGSEFTLVIAGKKARVSTRLLGKPNIDNIVTASALAYLLKVSLFDIVSAIKTLEPIPHRLELISRAGISILDDSYNSNIIGAIEALKVLDMFDGRKIVVTPGFVELGSESRNANFKLGTHIADVADYILIMNETNRNDILSGAISHNFNRKNIFFASTRKEQKEIIAKLTCENVVVLFENDLPDNFD